MTARTLDDILHRVLEKLLTTNNRIEPSRGKAAEYTGVLLKITNPRTRLSKTEKKGALFSCLGELLWYLSGKNDLEFITHYLSHYNKESSDGLTVYGGYGPRLFNKDGQNQIQNVLDLLKRNSFSRRAVIQLFDAKDITSNAKEIPCTCTLQFLIREKRLHMFTSMRSNDAFIGLPHDIFAFTMLQEIIARSLEVNLGTYNHAVGSLHLYDKDRKGAQQFLDEGWQSTTAQMPIMPREDPWQSINAILKAESDLRSGIEINVDALNLSTYWADLTRILQIWSCIKTQKYGKIPSIKRTISTSIYSPYIERKQAKRVVTETV